MADKRISALAEKTSLGASDYLVTDNASEAASKKVKTSYITDQLAAMQNVYGAKNLVPFPYYDTTMAKDGMTFTDNGDGSVTINGTSSRASGYTWFVFSERQNGDLILPAEKYTFSLEVISGSVSSGDVNAQIEKYIGVPGSTDGFAVNAAITNASISNDFTLSDERNISVMIRIKFGASLSNLRIRPMIRLACIKDDTYVMYAKTNKEITDELGSTDISSIGNGTVTGGISALNSALSQLTTRVLDTRVDVSNYTNSNKYHTSKDGYFLVVNETGKDGIGCVQDDNMLNIGGTDGNARYSVFIRKGMNIYINGTVRAAYFIPFNYQ